MSVAVWCAPLLDRTVDVVAAWAGDPGNAPSWYTWEPVDDGHTKMGLRNRGAPSGFARVVAPLLATAMKKAMKKAMTQDLKRLKQLLEEESG